MQHIIAEEGLVYLSKGTAENGQPYWAYLLVPFEKVEDYERASAAGGAFRLEEFGSILRWDYGESPPPKLMAEIEAKTPLKHDFVARMQDVLERTPMGRRILADAKLQIAQQKTASEGEQEA